MLKVGIVGLGRMGRLHMMNCLQIDNVEVVSAADQSKRNLRKAQQSGVRRLHTRYSDLLDESKHLDAVIISLPNHLHFESIQQALESGLDVFVEKPMANTLEECRKIASMAKRSGRKLMVGHNMRFIDAIGKVKNAVESGYIGDPQVLTLEEIMNGPFSPHAVPTRVPEWWFDSKKTGGGVLVDLGYHLIDLFRFFAGDCEALFSCLNHKYNLSVEDSAIVVLNSLDSSIRGIVNVGWYQKMIFPKYNFRLIVHGTAGYLSSDEFVPHNMHLHAIVSGMENIFRKILRKKIRPLSYTYYYESYYKELEHFFRCIENDADPSVSAIDGLKTMEIIEDIYLSCHKKNGASI